MSSAVRAGGRRGVFAGGVLAGLLGALLCGCPSAPDPCARFGFKHAGGTNPHVTSCTTPGACGNGEDPPTAGPHCPTPLACREFTSAQNRCQWIHNLEHGHAVLLWNCPGGSCPDDVAALNAIWQASPSPKRMVVTEDPLMAPKFAAVVWGWSWSGNAVDPEAIQCLIDSHQDQDAPEAGLGCAQ